MVPPKTPLRVVGIGQPRRVGKAAASGQIAGDSWLGKIFKVLHLCERYFRYEVVDSHHLPEGGAILALNNSLLPFDIAMLAHHIAKKRGTWPYSRMDPISFRIPLIRSLAKKFGVVDGKRSDMIKLLHNKQFIMVCPGGARERFKPSSRRYQLLWRRRFGFVQTAIAAGVPIVPCIAMGVDNTYLVLNDGYQWGKKIFGRYLPLPLFFGLGLLPLPMKITHYIGKPIDPKLPPEAAGNRRAVRRLHAQVMREAHRLIRRGKRERRLLGLAREYMEVLEDVEV